MQKQPPPTRKRFLFLGLMLAILAGLTASEEVINPEPAAAAIPARETDDSWYVSVTNDMGWSADVECNLDQFGYCLRNCTSYTAQRLAAAGVSTSHLSELGHGGWWYDKAKGKGIPVGNTPKVGAAAVIPGTPGHVAFVTAVHANGSYDVASYRGDLEVPQFEYGTTRYSHFIYFSNVGGDSDITVLPDLGHTVIGDFTGDGLSDAIALYDHGNNNLGAWIFAGNGDGVSRERQLWTTGENQWNWASSKFYAGNFNGDAHADIVAFYDYGDNNMGLWFFAGNATGLGRERLLWTTGPGQWDWSRM